MSANFQAVIAALFMNIYIVGLNQISDIDIDKVCYRRQLIIILCFSGIQWSSSIEIVLVVGFICLFILTIGQFELIALRFPQKIID